MNKCVKCGKEKNVEMYHIKAKSNETFHDVSNLAALCEGCHKEWHVLKSTSKTPFDVWIQEPPLVFLMAWLMANKKAKKDDDPILNESFGKAMDNFYEIFETYKANGGKTKK